MKRLSKKSKKVIKEYNTPQNLDIMTKLYKSTLFIVTVMVIIIYAKVFLAKEIPTHDSIMWYGVFHYYMESFISGLVPYWDPYTLTGMPFYPNIPLNGLLDPLVLLVAVFVKLFDVSLLTGFVYLHLARMVIFAWGAYYLFRYISKCPLSSLVSASVLFLSIAPVNFWQSEVDVVFLTPFALYFLLSFFDVEGVVKKYIYFLVFVLLTGITMGIYVPSYFLFNVIAFVIVALSMGIIKLRNTLRYLNVRGTVILTAVSVLLVAAMSVPSLSIYADTVGIKAELIPTLRILQKNEGVFKKIVASDLGDDALSPKYTNQLGIYSSYGNFVSLVYPDIWRYYFNDTAYFKSKRKRDFISEAFQYIGLVPFIISIIGFLYSKNRFRTLSAIMLILIFVNMFSYYGVHRRPSNAVQGVLNFIFPFLRMIEVREIFSGFWLLYLCVLLCLGLKILFNPKEHMDIIVSMQRHIIYICAGIIAAKVLIAYVFCGCFLYISNVDLIASLVVACFGLTVVLFSAKKIGHAVFCVALLTVSFADLAYYNITMKKFTVQENWLSEKLSSNKANAKEVFQYFRTTFVDFKISPMAFSEAMLRVKGALPKGDNHVVFTTKRFYDYVTHVPLLTQFALSGIETPIIRFFPRDKALTLKNKNEVLSRFTQSPVTELVDNLYMESIAIENAGQKGVIKNLSQYEDVRSLIKSNIDDTFIIYNVMNASRLRDVRGNPGAYLDTEKYKLAVEDFTPNSLVLTLKNNVDGYLYYGDGHSRYWKAFDEMKEIPIKTANYNFKAVFLEKGDHKISFVYEPGAFRMAMFVYYGALFVSVLMIGGLYYVGSRFSGRFVP